MVKADAGGLKAKFDHILSRERALAETVARALKTPRPLSVWEVLLPIFFIFNYARARAGRDLLIRNYLFTKELALEAALDLAREEISRAEALAPAEERTRELLAAVRDGIYSEEIRQKQLEEVNLLVDHYRLLLEAAGPDFESLVREAYGRLEKYNGFLDRLRAVENEVSRAALGTLGQRGDPGFAARLGEVTDQVRRRWARRIFGAAPEGDA
ncbi:MAG: NF038143 family protein [Thermodesulfobacteriota bacterium]